MRATTRRITIASVLLMGACTVGTRLTPIPSGVSIQATAPSGLMRTGELLSATPSGIYYLDPSDLIVFTGFSGEIEVRNSPGWPDVRVRGLPDFDDLGKLRTNSRYPLGLADERLARLLAALGQDEPEVWP